MDQLWCHMSHTPPRRDRVRSSRARGILFCESEGVVYELTVTTGIDRDIVHELYELHCPWFFTGATAPSVVPFTASTSGSLTYS